MRTSTTTILGLAASVSAAALPSTLLPREEGSCSNTDLPIEWQYNLGVTSFCNYFNPTPEDPNPTKIIARGDDLLATVVLNNYHGTDTLNWVYRIAVEGFDATLQPQKVTHEQCVRKMKEVLSEGNLGQQYCVVDGTEDVLFQGGKIEQDIKPWGRLVFESRRRNE